MKKEMEKILNSNGITLIALVITIIVMLILAGVSISVLTGNEGLFEKAQGAGETYNEAVQIEANQIQNLQNYFENYNANNSNEPKVEYDTLITPSEIVLYDVSKNIKNVEFTTFKQPNASGTLAETSNGLEYSSSCSSTLNWYRGFYIDLNLNLLNEKVNKFLKISVKELSGQCKLGYDNLSSEVHFPATDINKTQSISKGGEYEFDLSNYTSTNKIFIEMFGKNSSNIIIDKISIVQFPYINKDIELEISDLKSTLATASLSNDFITQIGGIKECKYIIKAGDYSKIDLLTETSNLYSGLEPNTTYNVYACVRATDDKTYILNKKSFTTNNDVLYLYNKGNEFVETTGEFKTYNQVKASITVTRNENNISYTTSASSTSSNYRGMYKDYDKTNEYSKLCVNITNISGSAVRLGIGTLVSDYNRLDKYVECTTPGTYYLDISDVGTIEKIFLSTYNNGSSAGEFDRLWLEK